jgi:hypothetical protein
MLAEEFWLAHLKRDSMRIDTMISAAQGAASRGQVDELATS